MSPSPPSPGSSRPHPAAVLERLRPQGVRLGLDRPRRLLAALGDPQRGYPVVLVAGTNGKGSTAHLLESMLRAGGLRTGLFTSPALDGPEEQIRTGGSPLAPEELGGLLQRALEASLEALGGDPTPFEALTAAAYLAFAEAGVQMAVVECGMGGARDATNVADAELAVLTTVGLEHRRFLGPDREAIAREKAGIFRRGRPALVGHLTPDAGPEEAARVVAAVRAETRRIGAELHSLAEEVGWEAPAVVPDAAGGRPAREVDLETPLGSRRLTLALAGQHQVRNLALAVRGVELLGDRGLLPAGFELAAAVRRGASLCRVPGRLEWVALEGPEPGSPGRRVLLDVAHDPQAVAALVHYLEAESPVLVRGWDLLFGVLEDKDAGGMLPPLLERCRRAWLTRPSDPRGRDPETLVQVAREGGGSLPGRGLEVEPEPARALERALAALPPGGTLLVCGSVVLVGEVRRMVRVRGAGRPEPPQLSGS